MVSFYFRHWTLDIVPLRFPMFLTLSTIYPPNCSNVPLEVGIQDWIFFLSNYEYEQPPIDSNMAGSSQNISFSSKSFASVWDHSGMNLPLATSQEPGMGGGGRHAQKGPQGRVVILRGDLCAAWGVNLQDWCRNGVLHFHTVIGPIQSSSFSHL